MTTQGMAIAMQSSMDRIIARERAVIAEAERMKGLAQGDRQFYIPTGQWDRQITAAKQRLSALLAGLVPLRIGGTPMALATMMAEGHPIPTPIVEQARLAKGRFPAGEVQVYGAESSVPRAERRSRDPVLTLALGGAQFFLGFWLEMAVPDAQAVPEFFGIVAPWAEPRGRGRPKKGVAGGREPMHALLAGQGGSGQ